MKKKSRPSLSSSSSSRTKRSVDSSYLYPVVTDVSDYDATSFSRMIIDQQWAYEDDTTSTTGPCCCGLVKECSATGLSINDEDDDARQDDDSQDDDNGTLMELKVPTATKSDSSTLAASTMGTSVESSTWTALTTTTLQTTNEAPTMTSFLQNLTGKLVSAVVKHPPKMDREEASLLPDIQEEGQEIGELKTDSKSHHRRATSAMTAVTSLMDSDSWFMEQDTLEEERFEDVYVLTRQVRTSWVKVYAYSSTVPLTFPSSFDFFRFFKTSIQWCGNVYIGRRAIGTASSVWMWTKLRGKCLCWKRPNQRLMWSSWPTSWSRNAEVPVSIV